MARRFVVVLLLILGGRITRSMDTTNSEITAINSPSGNQQNSYVSADSAVNSILIEISNGIFRSNDEMLISLVRRGMQEAGKSYPDKSRGSIEAITKKAQQYVTDVTSSYTQAIFHASSAEEAQNILQRFQETIELIVDYAKNSQSD